jgi:hypothetical protein
MHCCIRKHHQKKPKVKGVGYTGAVLSDMLTFVASVKLMLAYHMWCHYSGTLPREYQEDHDLVGFGKMMLVQYQDAIIYRGDDTIDSVLLASYTHSSMTKPMDLATKWDTTS